MYTHTHMHLPLHSQIPKCLHPTRSSRVHECSCICMTSLCSTALTVPIWGPRHRTGFHGGRNLQRTNQMKTYSASYHNISQHNKLPGDRIEVSSIRVRCFITHPGRAQLSEHNVSTPNHTDDSSYRNNTDTLYLDTLDPFYPQGSK